MHPDTLAALEQLAAALLANPADALALAIYGHLPEHVADALDDHQSEPAA